ncbi:hypothetical protein AZE42_13234 [Rhizopogon vesiculosus]|uniref:Uncharacterized protein n=1 Tax=Rhizopogon vesiculosus TaxID=180088 RepID=A0A1J8QJ23_9AGAM|nr:hypothetical protein AZE42_13234 [Rhizopogon vesiculosus]
MPLLFSLFWYHTSPAVSHASCAIALYPQSSSSFSPEPSQLQEALTPCTSLTEPTSTSNTPGTPSELPSQTQTPSGERLASPHTISVTNPGTRQHHLLNCHR